MELELLPLVAAVGHVFEYALTFTDSTNDQLVVTGSITVENNVLMEIVDPAVDMVV